MTVLRRYRRIEEFVARRNLVHKILVAEMGRPTAENRARWKKRFKELEEAEILKDVTQRIHKATGVKEGE